MSMNPLDLFLPDHSVYGFTDCAWAWKIVLPESRHMQYKIWQQWSAIVSISIHALADIDAFSIQPEKAGVIVAWIENPVFGHFALLVFAEFFDQIALDT